MKTLMKQRALAAFVAAGFAIGAAQAETGVLESSWRWTEAASVVEAVPPLPPLSTFPVQLVLDDDNAEGSFGVATQTARQFLWFNRFSPAAGFHLEEVWVLFPAGANMVVGGAVQIAIFADPDGDPSNGATLLQSFDTTIQAADGNTFSLYPLPASVLIDTGSDLLVGVVPRFIVSGVTSPTTPAALDTTTSQASSWIALWSTDPPDPPALVPLPDQAYLLVDALVPGGGNWMIRAFGSEQGITEIPTLDDLGLAVLALALLAAGVVLLRRRRAGVGAALALVLLAFGAPAGAVTIDTFTTNQAAISDPGTASSSVAGGAGDPIGTRRGMVVDLLTGAGPATASVAGGNLMLAVTATTPDSRGDVLVSWDGDTNPLVLSPTGLGNANLATGNASGFQLDFVSTTVVTEIEITVYEDAGNFSRAARRVPVSGAAQSVRIPFAEFRVASGAGADFTSVGAIEMTVRGGEGTITLNQVTTSAPTVAATKIDAQIVDTDGDTRVDPGDRVRYTVTVTNTGNQALAVDLADTVDPNTTLVAGSVSSTPVAHNDQYGWFGNVTLNVDDTPSFPGLLANDEDADGDTVTVQSGTFPALSALGGNLSLVDDTTGEFTYSPPVGFAGVDSFNYTIVDDNGNTATATANIALEGVIWFVDDSNTTAPFNGTLADPFQSLAAVNGAGGVGDPDGPGDTLFVYNDDGTPYAGGLVLEADQTLLGEAAGLVLAGTTIVPVGNRPQITNAAGAGLTLSSNNTLRGFDVQGTSAQGIFGGFFGTLTASDVNVLNAGGSALQVASGQLAATFGTLSSAGTNGSIGVSLFVVSGSLTVATTTLTNPSTHGIRVENSPGVIADFGNTTITDNAIGSGPTANGVFAATGNAGANLTFDSLSVTTDAGAGLVANGAGTINIGGTGNSIVANGGAAVDIVSTSLGSGATFATLTSTNSTSKGVNLDTVTGSFTANGGSISNATGACFDLNGGAGNVTYTGPISCTANAFLVEITGRTGGTVTLSGNLSGTSASNGINVASNSGGTINFSGGTKTLNTGADAAVTLATNTGATLNFTGGGLDIDTTSGAGFKATGGAAGISVQGAGNTIASTTGTPLEVANSTIGASGLTFLSIAANGAANGIVLNTTGSSGGLTVTGTGTTDGSGGTIQNTSNRGASFASASSISLSNMNFTNAGTSDLDADNSGLSTGDNLVTNAAIHLQTVTGASLTNLNISGGAEQGINGNNVSNFTLSNSSIIDVGNGPDEDGIHFFNMSGTSSITNTTFNCTVATHNTLGAGGDDHVNLQMQSGTLNLTISGGSAINANKGSGYLMGIRGTSSATVTVDGVTSDNNFSGGIVIDTFDTATSVIEIMNSTSTNNNDAISMSSNNGSTKFDIHDNVSFAGTDFGRINILKAALSTTGTLEGKIRNNPIVVTDGQTADGIFVFQAGDGTLTVSITNNTITYRGTQRPINIQGGQDGSGQLNATVTGNNIDMQLDGTGNAVTGIFAQTAVASPSGDNTHMCADIGGAGALGNVFTHSMGGNMAAGEIRVRQRFVTTVTLPGYGGANNDNAAVVTYLAGRNTLVNSPAATATNEVGVTPGAGGFVSAASCPQPNFP